MKKPRYTEQQIGQALRQTEQSTPAAEICRRLGVSEATFYLWKKRYAGRGVAELRRHATGTTARIQVKKPRSEGETGNPLVRNNEHGRDLHGSRRVGDSAPLATRHRRGCLHR